MRRSAAAAVRPPPPPPPAPPTTSCATPFNLLVVLGSNDRPALLHCVIVIWMMTIPSMFEPSTMMHLRCHPPSRRPHGEAQPPPQPLPGSQYLRFCLKSDRRHPTPRMSSRLLWTNISSMLRGDTAGCGCILVSRKLSSHSEGCSC